MSPSVRALPSSLSLYSLPRSPRTVTLIVTPQPCLPSLCTSAPPAAHEQTLHGASLSLSLSLANTHLLAQTQVQLLLDPVAPARDLVHHAALVALVERADNVATACEGTQCDERGREEPGRRARRSAKGGRGRERTYVAVWKRRVASQRRKG
jgi:hypothetical protein